MAVGRTFSASAPWLQALLGLGLLMLCTLLPVASTATQQQQQQQQNQQPNIVLFLADDLGIGDVGCFGNDTLRTPSIDRIAAEGVRLTHHLAAASVCTPSRAAFLTGRYPIRMGMVPTDIVRVNMFLSSVSGIPPHEVTFAEMAKQKGYTTAAVGKWHLGLHCDNATDFCHHPLKQGFDYYYGVPLTNLKDFGGSGDTVSHARFIYLDQMMISAVIGGCLLLLLLKRNRIIGTCVCVILTVLIGGLALGIYWFYSNLTIFNSIAMRNYDVVEQPIRWRSFTRRLVREGREFLESRHRDGRPFLLYLPWAQVHSAMHASPAFQGRSKHGPYGDEVEEMDWSVGQILDTLEELGLKENTLVYFSSDNGGFIEETGPSGNREGGWNGIYKGGKTQGGMEGGIRVPTVAMWPGKIPPGTVIDVPTSQMDVFATLAALLHLPLPADRIIDGVDIMPLLTGKSQSPPHEFLFHYCGDQLHAARYTPGDGRDVWKMHLATPVWKKGTQHCDSFVCDCYGSAVRSHDPPLLYNSARDPGEEQLLNSSIHEDVVSRMLEAIKRHKETLSDVPDQYAPHRLLPRPWLQPCCPGNTFPFCDCTDAQHQDVLD